MSKMTDSGKPFVSKHCNVLTGLLLVAAILVSLQAGWSRPWRPPVRARMK